MVRRYEPKEARDRRHPDFARRAEAEAQVVELGEGDVVLFPPFWWHHVETLDALSCSLGCRYVR